MTNLCLQGPEGGAGGKRAPRTVTWPARLGGPSGHWALAPAREKLQFLEVRISTCITVLSAECRGD